MALLLSYCKLQMLQNTFSSKSFTVIHSPIHSLIRSLITDLHSNSIDHVLTYHSVLHSPRSHKDNTEQTSYKKEEPACFLPHIHTHPSQRTRGIQMSQKKLEWKVNRMEHTQGADTPNHGFLSPTCLSYSTDDWRSSHSGAGEAYMDL